VAEPDHDRIEAGERLGGAVVVAVELEAVELARELGIARHRAPADGDEHGAEALPFPGLGLDLPAALGGRPRGGHLGPKPDVLAQPEVVGEGL
jgi:hypothetical protein